MTPFEAAREATADIGLAVLATTLSLVVIFVPVSFMSSDLRPLPLPVRHHRGGGGAGQPARVVHAHADDERAPAAQRTRRRRRARRATAATPRRAAASTAARSASTRGCSACSMRHRLVVSRSALRRHRLDACRSIGSVKQEFVPSDVDEAEFEVQRRRPARARAWPPWTRRCRPSTEELRSDAGRAARAGASAGGGFLGGVNQGTSTCASRRTRSARSRLHALWNELLTATRSHAFRGNYTQRDVMQRAAAALSQVPRHPHRRCATSPASTSAAATSTSTSSLRGPDLETARRVRRAAPQAEGPRASPASSTPTPRCSSTSPSSACASTASAPPTSASTPRDIATALRLMVGGDEEVSRFRDPQRQRGLRRAAPPDRRRPQRPRHDLAAVRVARLDVERTATGAAAQVGMAPAAAGAARQPRAHRADADRVAHRPLGPPARGRASAPQIAPGYAPGRPHRGAARGGGGDEPAAGVHHRHLRPRPRAGADLHGVPLGVPAVGRVHVHDPGLAVREPGPPADHPALAAAVGARSRCCRCGYTGNTLNLYSALGHPRAVRRGEEERDPADRPHEQPPRRTA